MDELKWGLLTETAGRLQADLLKSHLEAAGIEVELFQEAVGRHIYPVMVDGLGRVQIFVPKSQLASARAIIAEYSQEDGPDQ
jgi:Putative prokaryotic signal transducing protein